MIPGIVAIVLLVVFDLLMFQTRNVLGRMDKPFGTKVSKQQPVMRKTHIIWEEEEHASLLDETKLSDTVSQREQTRQLLSVGRFDGFMDHINLNDEATVQESHPLRTDEWNVTLHWRKHTPLMRLNGTTTWNVQFHSNGYARFREAKSETNSNNNDFVSVGSWDILPTGRLVWMFPCVGSNKNSRRRQLLKEEQQDFNDGNLLFFADIHPNPFGSQPKMTRGFVILQKPQRRWFRPIVATFSAIGIGIDTADFSYQSRR